MEQAMETLKEKYEFNVRWEPFFLRPDTPPEGIPKPASYGDRSNPRVQMLINTGEELGLKFSYKASVFPSTLKAHALMEYAKDQNGGSHQNDVAEKLFEKYFADGDLLKEESLLNVAQEVGFDKSEVKSYLDNESVLKRVFEKAIQWSQHGISGVPTFYFNGKQVFSGAQDVDTFVKMFDIINARFPLQTDSKN